MINYESNAFERIFNALKNGEKIEGELITSIIEELRDVTGFAIDDIVKAIKECGLCLNSFEDLMNCVKSKLNAKPKPKPKPKP